MSNYTLVQNVADFLSKTSEAVGRFAADEWSQEMYCRMVEQPISSPIEQLFYAALSAMARTHYIEMDPDPIKRDGEWDSGFGLHVYPQAKVGPYTVDFMLVEVDPNGAKPAVVVELDGHDFHDKDKRQRSYEKARDRYLVKQGYKVLHFTGSDVVRDPFAVAHEALEMAGSTVDPYDASNPLGVE